MTWYDQSGNGYDATQTDSSKSTAVCGERAKWQAVDYYRWYGCTPTASVIAGMPWGDMQAVVKINTYVENTTIVHILISGDDFATIPLTGPSSLDPRRENGYMFRCRRLPAEYRPFAKLPALSWTGTTNTAWQPYHNASAKTTFSTTGLMTGTGGYIAINSNLTVSELIICRRRAVRRQPANGKAGTLWGITLS